MTPTIGINSSIDGFTVIKINRTSVTLSNGTTQLSLSFRETEKFFKV